MESSLSADSITLAWLWLQQAVSSGWGREEACGDTGRDVPATLQPGRKHPAGFTGPV